MSPSVPKVFISYRREETAGHAGRLYDVMAGHFGDGNVFMDVDIAPGVDFVEQITEAVGGCHVLLVVMGPKWATLSDNGEQARIREADDFVRLEVETALRREDVTVIPLLVAGARMPEAADLPEPLHSLARRNAHELSDHRWRYDVEQLMSALDQLLAGTTGAHELPPTPETAEPATPLPSDTAETPEGPVPALSENRGPGRLVFEGALVALAGALAGRGIAELFRSDELTTDTSRIVDTVAWRGLTWAILGLALAIWLTSVRGDQAQRARFVLRGLVVGALAGVVGGALLALPVNLPSDPPSIEVRHLLNTASFAVTGGLLAAMIGSLWIPRRVGVALLAGAAGGAVVQALINNRGWNINSTGENLVAAGVRSVVVVGVVLIVLTALDVRRVTATTRTSFGSGSPAAGQG